MSSVVQTPVTGFVSAAQVLQIGLGFDAPKPLLAQKKASAPPLAPAVMAQERKSQPDAIAAPAKPRGRPRKAPTLVLEMPSEALQIPLDGLGVEIDKHYVIGHYSIKHPKIFPTPNTKNLDKPRTVVLERASAESNAKQLVLLGNSVTSCYTTQTLSVIAVLNDMWQEQGGGEDGLVMGSYAEMFRRLKLPADNESRGRAMIKTELQRLRRLPMLFSELDHKQAQKLNAEVSYLSHYDYVEDQRQSHKNHFRVNIDSFFTKGIRRGLIASLPIKSLLEVKQSESRAILLRIDSLLVYNQRVLISKAVFADLLCIEADSYMHTRAVYLQRLMTKVCEDLNGRILSNGCVLKTRLEEGDKGPRILFERGECVVPLDGGRVLGMVNTDEAVVNRLKIDMLAAVGEKNPGAVESLYELYARTYPAELIERAISVFKVDKPRTEVLNSAGAFFSSVLCRIVKENGFKWIR
jgi:hypothetical protein